MSPLVLVDSSAWIQAMRVRTDRPDIAGRVRQLLTDEQAAWCDVVRVELWNGPPNTRDRESLLRFELQVTNLPITREVWNLACETAARARRNGLIIPATDLTIFACATVHGVRIEAVDRHFDLLGRMSQP